MAVLEYMMDLDPVPLSRSLNLTTPGEKLLVPTVFNSRSALSDIGLHPFATTGEIKKKIDTDLVDWVSPNVAYAVLRNGDAFWLNVVDKRRFHGGCALVKTALFADDVSSPSGYSGDEDTRAKEKQMKNVKSEVNPGVRGTPLLNRFDTYGTVWHRRRYTLEDNATYTFVQWMDAKAVKLKEKPIASRLLDLASNVQSLEESCKQMKIDVSEMRVMLNNYTTLSSASLALAESLKEVIKEQSTAHSVLSEQIEKLRSELRREA